MPNFRSVFPTPQRPRSVFPGVRPPPNLGIPTPFTPPGKPAAPIQPSAFGFPGGRGGGAVTPQTPLPPFGQPPPTPTPLPPGLPPGTLTPPGAEWPPPLTPSDIDQFIPLLPPPVGDRDVWIGSAAAMITAWFNNMLITWEQFLALNSWMNDTYANWPGATPPPGEPPGEPPGGGGAQTCPAGEHWDDIAGQCLPDVTPPDGDGGGGGTTPGAPEGSGIPPFPEDPAPPGFQWELIQWSQAFYVQVGEDNDGNPVMGWQNFPMGQWVLRPIPGFSEREIAAQRERGAAQRAREDRIWRLADLYMRANLRGRSALMDIARRMGLEEDLLAMLRSLGMEGEGVTAPGEAGLRWQPAGQAFGR